MSLGLERTILRLNFEEEIIRPGGPAGSGKLQLHFGTWPEQVTDVFAPHTSPGDAKALGAVNLVRRRAKLPDLQTTTQTALRNAIWQERRVELVSESNRYFDLIRTGRLVQRVTSAKTTGVPKAAMPKEIHNVMPIPQREIDANSSLKQNTGY